VDRYFPNSNSCRFNFDIYPANGKVDFLRRFDVDSSSKSICADMVYFSTSILRRKVSVQTWYIFQLRFNVEISLYEDCRFINVGYKSIPRRCFPLVFVDFSTLNTSPMRIEDPNDVPFTFLSTLHQRCKLKNIGEWIYRVN